LIFSPSICSTISFPSSIYSPILSFLLPHFFQSASLPCTFHLSCSWSEQSTLSL
jgi:hypothetical protein